MAKFKLVLEETVNDTEVVAVKLSMQLTPLQLHHTLQVMNAVNLSWLTLGEHLALAQLKNHFAGAAAFVDNNTVTDLVCLRCGETIDGDVAPQVGFDLAAVHVGCGSYGGAYKQWLAPSGCLGRGLQRFPPTKKNP